MIKYSMIICMHNNDIAFYYTDLRFFFRFRSFITAKIVIFELSVKKVFIYRVSQKARLWILWKILKKKSQYKNIEGIMFFKLFAIKVDEPQSWHLARSSMATWQGTTRTFLFIKTFIFWYITITVLIIWTWQWIDFDR